MGKSPEREKLEEAIANLYLVFEEYPMSLNIGLSVTAKQKKSRSKRCIQNI